MYMELFIVPLNVTFLFNIYSYFNLTTNFINNEHKHVKKKVNINITSNTLFTLL